MFWLNLAFNAKEATQHQIVAWKISNDYQQVADSKPKKLFKI
jgi:hypothetical protein